MTYTPVKSTVAKLAKPRHYILWGILFILVTIFGTLGWLSYRATAALSKISQAPNERANLGGILPILGQREATLKGEDDDRINILLLGIGGAGHAGAELTDTMEILSLKPKEGRIGLLSVPRDLYVPIPGFGSGKINSANALGERREKGQGPTLTKTTVGNVLGIPIHYYVEIDFKGFVKIVDALGGVDISVDKAIADPFYPSDIDESYDPFYLKAGPTHMDGKLALKYARSRETTSDFDRSRRQQQLLAALKDKALSLGTLTNPQKLSQLIDIVGDHVRTDLAVWEMERLVGFSKTIDMSKAVTKVLDTSADGPLVGQTDPQAGYIILPRHGNFSEIQSIAQKLFETTVEKPASIAIENASGKTGLGGTVALLLRGYGYQVTHVTENKKIQATTRIIEKKPGQFNDTVSWLVEQFKATKESGATNQSTDITLIIGQDYTQ